MLMFYAIKLPRKSKKNRVLFEPSKKYKRIEVLLFLNRSFIFNKCLMWFINTLKIVVENLGSHYLLKVILL